MKRITGFLLFIAFIIACNSNDSQKESTKEAKENQAETPTDPEAEKGLQLVAKDDCFQCHDVSVNKIGPAYETIAQKYQDEKAVRDSLAARIIKGSVGHWGTVPMTSHPDLSPEDAATMVHYVLSLKK